MPRGGIESPTRGFSDHFIVGVDSSAKPKNLADYDKRASKIRTALGGLTTETAPKVTTENLHQLFGLPYPCAGLFVEGPATEGEKGLFAAGHRPDLDILGRGKDPPHDIVLRRALVAEGLVQGLEGGL